MRVKKRRNRKSDCGCFFPRTLSPTPPSLSLFLRRLFPRLIAAALAAALHNHHAAFFKKRPVLYKCPCAFWRCLVDLFPDTAGLFPPFAARLSAPAHPPSLLSTLRPGRRQALRHGRRHARPRKNDDHQGRLSSVAVGQRARRSASAGNTTRSTARTTRSLARDPSSSLPHGPWVTAVASALHCGPWYPFTCCV